jgi:hypothetical protein
MVAVTRFEAEEMEVTVLGAATYIVENAGEMPVANDPGGMGRVVATW